MKRRSSILVDVIHCVFVHFLSAQSVQIDLFLHIERISVFPPRLDACATIDAIILYPLMRVIPAKCCHVAFFPVMDQ